MGITDETMDILNAYLRLLSVKISIKRIRKLLDNPLGDTLRGISDALDQLQIENAVYQLPKEYFEKLEAPFIAVLSSADSPFCIVERINESTVCFSQKGARHRCVDTDSFIYHWTGAVLLVEKNEYVFSEPYRWLSDLWEYVMRYKLVVGCIVGLIIILVTAFQHSPTPLFIIHLCMLWLGVCTSFAIIYKEYYRPDFLHRFCKIGKSVDCNEVLHSEGSILFGRFHLGELSLLFFSSLLIVAILSHSINYVTIAMAILGCLFTLYSIIYQAIVIQKWCMLCMCVNLLIWIEVILVGGSTGWKISHFQWLDLIEYLCVFAFCTLLWLQFREIITKEKSYLRLHKKLGALYQSPTFEQLLSSEEIIPEIEKEFLLHNNAEADGNPEILVIINPSCKACARLHSQLQQLAMSKPISLSLAVSTGDKQSEWVAQQVISCYLSEGWEKALTLMGSLFKKKKSLVERNYPISSQAQNIYIEQQRFHKLVKLKYTPQVIVNQHLLPDVYDLEDLIYLL